MPTSDRTQQLSIEDAARILNVSLGDVSSLLERGAIESTTSEGSPRVRLDHLLNYKDRRDDDRRRALDALTEMSQTMGGYDELD